VATDSPTVYAAIEHEPAQMPSMRTSIGSSSATPAMLHDVAASDDQHPGVTRRFAAEFEVVDSWTTGIDASGKAP
jgi:hypothetical protein